MCRPWVFRTDDQDEACLLVSRRRTVEASGVPGYRELMGRFGCLKPGSNRSGLQLQLDRLRDLLAGKIPCAEVLYASHPERLQAAFGTVARRLCSEHRAIGLVADERRLGLPPDPTRHNAGHYYCIPNGGPVDEFDALYAEFLLMRM
jgi:hypothetical protein